MVEEQEHLHSAACKAEDDVLAALQTAAEASAQATHLQKQLDFLKGQDC